MYLKNQMSSKCWSDGGHMDMSHDGSQTTSNPSANAKLMVGVDAMPWEKKNCLGTPSFNATKHKYSRKWNHGNLGRDTVGGRDWWDTYLFPKPTDWQRTALVDKVLNRQGSQVAAASLAVLLHKLTWLLNQPLPRWPAVLWRYMFPIQGCCHEPIRIWMEYHVWVLLPFLTNTWQFFVTFLGWWQVMGWSLWYFGDVFMVLSGLQRRPPETNSFIQFPSGNRWHTSQAHRIYVWYIYLHLVDFYGKCR